MGLTVGNLSSSLYALIAKRRCPHALAVGLARLAVFPCRTKEVSRNAGT
jgi:hypothetical protein